MPFVLKSRAGYARGRSRYTMTTTADLQKARVYDRVGDAKNSYGKGEVEEVVLIPVEQFHQWRDLVNASLIRNGRPPDA